MTRTMLFAAAVCAALPIQAQQPGRIQLGQTIRGALAAGDAMAEDNTYYDDYLIQLRQGQRLEVRMRSDAFDTFVGVGPWGDGDFTDILAMDDDGEGEGSTNSLLVVTVPQNGEYVIRANALNEGGMGAYTLSVTELPPAAAPSVRPIEIGQPVRDQLSSTDSELDDGSYYDLWAFDARAGETYEISLESDEFDCYVAVGTLTGDQLDVIDTNDDAEEGNLNSLLRITATQNGRLVIRANSLSAGETGAYTLTVRRAGSNAGSGMGKN